MAADAQQDRRNTAAAASLSPEFLEGSTEAGLEKIRTRLLDLTNRNRLLNFRYSTASSLRIVDVDIDAVFRRLLDGEKLPFHPVPEPDLDIDDTDEGGASHAQSAKPSASDYAATLGWHTAYDLQASDSAGHSDTLPVLHYVEGLETLTRKIGSAAKTAIEESGTNMLYLVLGFLEWYEAEDSQQPRYAPLLTVPLTLERNGAKGHGFECIIEYSGDDFATNLSLVERMRRDFALEIPLVEDDDSPEKYFARFADILVQKRRWRIRRQVALALLSFGKLLMYRDLDPKTWPEIVKHPLVKELFEGSKSDAIVHAEEYPIDDPKLKTEVPPLILDADSSQHSALIHALRGQNLVIEGPPGTGKSQTITNLIAAALGKGKTVLFVAEKLAALEVVRRRLDEAGLGLFCLELHSHKTKKHALLNDLEARLKAHGSFHDPGTLDQHLSVVEDKKQLLTRYSGLMNKRLEPFNATPFEILWARERFYRELPFTGELKGNVPDAPQYTRAQYAAKEQLLSVYAQHLATVLRVCSSLQEHAWAWVTKLLSFEDEDRVIDLLSSFAQMLNDADGLLITLKKLTGIALENSIAGMRMASEIVAGLPEPDAIVNSDLLESCSDINGRQMLGAFVSEVEDALTQFHALQAVFEDPKQLLRSDIVQAIADAFGIIKTLRLHSYSLAQLRDVLASGQSTEAALSEAQTSLTSLQSLLGCETPSDSHGITLLRSCLRLLEIAPFDCLHLRTAALEADGARRIVQGAAVEAETLRQRSGDLSISFDVSLAKDVNSVRRLSDHATIVEEAGFLQVWFGRDYKQAVRTYRRLVLSGRKARRETMSRDFRALSDYFHKYEDFEAQALYRDTLSSHFRGVASDWDSLLSLMGWYEEVFTALPEHDARAAQFRELLLKARTERLRGLKASLVSHAEDIRVLGQVQTAISSLNEILAFSGGTSCTVQDMLQALRSKNSQLAEALKLLNAAGVRDDQALNRVPEWLEAIANYQTSVSRTSTNVSARNLLGAQFKGTETEVEPIKQALAFANCVSNGKLPECAAQWILCSEFSTRISQLRSCLARIASCREKLTHVTKEIDVAAESSPSLFGENEPLGVLRQRAEKALESPEELPAWIHFLRVRKQIQDAGLAKLASLAESKTISPQHLLPAFRFLFYNSLARSILAEYPILYQFDGVTQEQARQQFACSDKESIRLYSERLASIIDSREVPYGIQRGPVGFWTDLALITHEVNKQKRHIPIRQLVRRAGGALQALKPCFMMGPLSVAQYLAPGELQFDLIVMDEASQLKPEDAVGAIARGGQIVIVGDPKQLPPTNFFQRVSLDAEDDGDDDSRTVVEEGESILDVASTLYQPVRRLRWHYRSRHHSLIAFSNREFYNDDLIIFPSAYHEDSNLGVKYHPVSAGIFENRRNAPEAEFVVKAVMEHMEKRPDESLGVVTLNLEQRDLIEELLDKRLRTDPFASAYQERMNNGAEPFFVKNLENVQGDERDVMFVSVTYGPDARGNLYQRFGPINGANGHRRLNVLFTRAKKRTEIFSSLDPDKIRTNASSPWGLRALKDYLGFARTGILAAPDEGSEQPTNDFERSVGLVLKENGFDVVPQVGVTGFFIDLAIKHPSKPGKFLLGIECDGASYHSGKSARDRDRLRQEILENLGWKLHRVWSTDWFKSRANEIKRLLQHVEELLANDPDYLRETERVKRMTSLRQQLIDVRNEISRAFPDTPPEKELLRDELLEVFLTRHPKTKEEWFRMFSMELRTSTDSRQVAQFLDRVFEIIARSWGGDSPYRPQQNQSVTTDKLP